MRRNKIALVLSFALLATFGLSLNGFANSVGEKDKKSKRPKNSGIIAVQTLEKSYSVKIDGEMVGMSGIEDFAEFYRPPGTYTVEVEGPGGSKFTQTVTIKKNQKVCICLKVNEIPTTRPCPYKMQITKPSGSINEDEEAVFSVRDVSTGDLEGAVLKYLWSVTPAAVIAGQGTDTIRVSTKGLGDQTLYVVADVTDNKWGETCAEKKTAEINVNKTFKPPPPRAFECDVFAVGPADDLKARLDNCAIELNNNPFDKLTVIIRQGDDKLSQSANNYTRTEKLVRDYLVIQRNVDENSVDFRQGPKVPGRTTIKIWIVPPGATIPDELR